MPVSGGEAVVFDQPLFLRTLSRFAVALPGEYDLQQALTELTESVTAILDLAGSGVTLAEADGRLGFATAVGAPYVELERIQEQFQRGPCREAFDTAEIVSVPDARLEQDRWGEYAVAARRLGVAGVAGVPMRLGDRLIGAVNLYAGVPRAWAEEDLHVATVLAGVATGYIVNASKVQQLEQLTDQLRRALESRVLIEQAKGVISEHRAVTVDEAFARMRRHARDHNTGLRAVAQSVIDEGLRV